MNKKLVTLAFASIMFWALWYTYHIVGAKTDECANAIDNIENTCNMWSWHFLLPIIIIAVCALAIMIIVMEGKNNVP